jgi:hypothetical protein
MATPTPAKVIGVNDRKGSLEAGKDADDDWGEVGGWEKVQDLMLVVL